jgi:hypothetical protein
MPSIQGLPEISKIQISLPALNQKIEIPATKEVTYNENNSVISETYTATTTEDLSTKITRVLGLIQSSNITSYIKTRYTNKLTSIQKTKDEKSFTAMQQKIDRAVRSIDSYANSPALKGRYTKLRQDYIYLAYVLK